MDFLFIGDPLDSLKLQKDSTVAMMRAAQAAGHRLWYTESRQLFWQAGFAFADCCTISLQPTSTSWYKLGISEVCTLDRFTAVLMRQDPPFNVEYLNATWILSAAVRQGARVFNEPSALRNQSEKLSITEFASFIPPTLVSRELAAISAFHAEYHDIVLKPLDGMGGRGVFRVGPDGLNLASIVEILGENGQRTLMAQQFLPQISTGDKRVLLIAGQVVPYALARIPQGTEIRGNLAAGGKGVAMLLSDQEKAVAAYLAPILWDRGLFLVGLDLIGGYLTEINVTSPTCFVELTEQTGLDVAQFWLQALEKELT